VEYARKFGITLENFRPGESVFIKDILRDGEPGVVKTGTRTIGGRPFRVVGLFTSGYVFGDNQLFLPYATFQKHYGYTDRISKLFVTVDRVENVPAVAEAIRTRYPEVDVATREDGARFMSKALATMRRIGDIWVGGMVALAAGLVLFAMLLATDERMRELGTLKALGASFGDIATAVLWESALLAGLSAASGALLYAAFGASLGRAFFGATLGVYLPGQYGESLLDNMTVSYDLSLSIVLGLAAAAAVAGALGSLYALFKAERLSPVEALRHE
jgi:ABC-type lipoprotein release transport system permease subunit